MTVSPLPRGNRLALRLGAGALPCARQPDGEGAAGADSAPTSTRRPGRPRCRAPATSPARCLPDGLGGEEGIEDALEHLRRDAAAGVAHREHDVVAAAPAAGRRHARRRPGAGVQAHARASPPAASPAPRSCTGSSPPGASASRRRASRRRRRCRCASSAHARRQRCAPAARAPRRTTACDVTGTRSPTPLRLNARMRSTSARPRSPAAMTLSRSRRSALPVARVALRHLAVAEDRAEDVVEVVRDAAGQRAHRLQLLRLAQLRFEPSRSASAFLRSVMSSSEPATRVGRPCSSRSATPRWRNQRQPSDLAWRSRYSTSQCAAPLPRR